MCVWAPDATLTGGESVNCHLDGLGRRVARQVSGGAWICLIYQDNAHQIGMVDASGNVTEQVVYGTRGNSPDYMIKNGVSYRIISDERGSVRLVVNATDGTVAQRMDYDVWGNVTADTAPGFQPFGFAGGIYDSVTGLVRFGARDYDASTARWTAKDPILFNGGQANLYVYTGNDPINRVDPRGTDAQAVLINGFHSGVQVDNPNGSGDPYIIDFGPQGALGNVAALTNTPLPSQISITPKSQYPGFIVPIPFTTVPLDQQGNAGLLNTAKTWRGQNGASEGWGIPYQLLGPGGINCHGFTSGVLGAARNQ